MPQPTPSSISVPLSTKQADILQRLQNAFTSTGAKLRINEPLPVDESRLVSLDIEHDESGGFVGLGLYSPTDSSVYYFTSLHALSLSNLQSIHFVAHNGKSDIEGLRQWGFDIKNSQLVHDTELIGHILDSSLMSYGLKDMAKRELGIEYPDYDEIVGTHKRKTKKTPACPKTTSDCCNRVTLDKQPFEIVSLYNAMDCIVTWKLYERQSGPGSAGSPSRTAVQYFNDLEKPVSYVFQSMENRGVRVDLKYLALLKDKLKDKQQPIKEAILNELGDINLNSPKQLLEALHAKGIWPELKGKPSTDKRAIERFRDVEVIDSLLRFSELETLLSSFVYPYLQRGQEVVHPFFNQCGTRTGRPSCKNPNLLQIPKRTDNGKLVRRMFIPREGFIMGDCDFGQIEPRVLAHISKDQAMCTMFNEGTDFHEFTSQRLNISRDRAKVLNLSVGYRATWKSVGSQLKCDQKEAQAQIDAWWSMFPQLRRWQEKLIFDSKRSGYFTTLMGRRIKVDNLNESNMWHREAAERQLINNIAQGSAAEIMKTAMIKIHQENPSLGLLVQVYDELLFESVDMVNDLKTVMNCMVNAVKLDVPLTVDAGTGPNWEAAKV